MRRRVPFYFGAVMLILLLTGCGMYHKADITGYVKNSASGYGINGADLKVYLTEDAVQSGEGYILETSSMIYNGNPGYFTFTAVWQRLFSEYGSEGDVTELWIHAGHDEYSSKTVHVSGITSDTMNIIPDIELEAVVYTAQQVSGWVTDGTGPPPNGVDGVRVVLDLASTEKNPDYVAVSSTVESGGSTQSGVYTFVNVQWRDEVNIGRMTDEEMITISVDDSTYTGDRTLERSVTSGTGVSMMDLESAIVVAK